MLGLPFELQFKRIKCKQSMGVFAKNEFDFSLYPLAFFANTPFRNCQSFKPANKFMNEYSK